jgi:hypothetical protein
VHYHTEIIIPPTDDIVTDIATVLAPFNEHSEDEEEDNRYAFWDWYVIGGRWAGHKLMASLDQERLAEFRSWLQTQKLTVSGLTAGKHELSPSSQQAIVDAKWNEMFPSETFSLCPLFNHSNDQYGKGLSGTMQGDICKLADLLPGLTRERVIIAGPRYDLDRGWVGKPEAVHMVTRSFWNGVTWQDSTWDGKVETALGAWREELASYAPEYRDCHTPTGEWLCVTVDYHT